MEQSLVFLCLIIITIWILYIRTINYFFIIDDFVEAEGYYTVGFLPPPFTFFEMKPGMLKRFKYISLHCLNVFIVYLIWGWIPALILAIHPMSVWMVSWKTGSYYSTATFFTLTAYYFIHNFPNIWGILIALLFYNAAINCTVCPVAFPMLAILNPLIAPLWIMVLWLFNSKRWKTAMKVRNSFYDSPVKYEWRRIILMTKVVARYTYQAIIPSKPSMFTSFGHMCRDNKEVYDEMHRIDSHFYFSFLFVMSVFIIGLFINPFAICWWFFCIGLHSQWNLTGQFYAQRYIYLASIGLYVVIAEAWKAFPAPIEVKGVVGVAYITWLITKTNAFIPAFRDMANFWRNDIKTTPEYYYTYNNLAIHLMSTEGYVDEIEHLLCEAERIKPDAWETQLNLSKLLMCKGEHDEALRCSKKGLELCTDRIGCAVFYERIRKLEEQIEKHNVQKTS